MAGLLPAISLRGARCLPCRDRRDKPGHDGAPLSIGKPYAVRRGTPADRVAILRDAFAKMVHDPGFVTEAAAAQIDMQYIGAEEVTKDFTAMMNPTPEALEPMSKYLTVGE